MTRFIPRKRKAYKLVEGPHGYQRVMETSRKPMARPEQDIQVAIFNDLRPIMAAQKCQHFLALAIPNGGYRTAFEGKKLKEMGVMPGATDILLLTPRMNDRVLVDNGHGGGMFIHKPRPPRAVFIELKAIAPAKPPRLKKDGTPVKQRARNEKAGQEESQKNFESIVTAFGFDYHLLAATDLGDGVKKMRALLRGYNVEGF